MEFIIAFTGPNFDTTLLHTAQVYNKFTVVFSEVFSYFRIVRPLITYKGLRPLTWNNMLAINIAYNHSRYERRRLNSFPVMSNINSFNTKSEQTTGGPHRRTNTQHYKDPCVCHRDKQCCQTADRSTTCHWQDFFVYAHAFRHCLNIHDKLRMSHFPDPSVKGE